MASKDIDRVLSSFIAITQCPHEQAREYLELTDWNEQAAVSLYFDSLGSSMSDPVPPKKQQTH